MTKRKNGQSLRGHTPRTAAFRDNNNKILDFEAPTTSAGEPVIIDGRPFIVLDYTEVTERLLAR